jgi:phenylacetate-CoA ligase
MFSLETWIHQIAGNALGIDSTSRVNLEAYRLLRLHQTIQYAYEKSSFYREMFDKAGFVPDDLRSFGDLSGIPFTEPCHLSEAPYRFLCTSQAEIARPFSFITSGTTGPQKKVFLSQGDLEKIIEFMAAGIATVANQEDVVQILLADGRPYSQADLLYRGVERMGATPVISGMNIGAEEQLRILEKSHSTILFGYTNQIFRLSTELQHKTDLIKTGVKVLFLAGEYLPEAMRQELQKIWNCRIYTHYGLTEMGLGVAVECDAHAGYHFNEAGLYLEVINPRTGEVVPPGEEGELVFTTLAREAMPLVRYRTHDISRLIPGPCPCGTARLLRIDNVRKRLESIVTLDGGDEIYPSLFDDVLFGIRGLMDYQAILTRQEGKDLLEFRAEVFSPEPSTLPEIYRTLLSVPGIAHAIASGRMVEPRVVLANSDTTAHSIGRAKKLLVDGRQQNHSGQDKATE